MNLYYGWGGGVEHHGRRSFLSTSALSLVVHPDKPEHTADKVYKTPKERGFLKRYMYTHLVGPFFFFFFSSPETLIDCVTSSSVFAMCGEVGEEWGFLGADKLGYPENTLLPFRQREYNIMKVDHLKPPPHPHPPPPKKRSKSTALVVLPLNTNNQEFQNKILKKALRMWPIP
jgi:hypothetical protein